MKKLLSFLLLMLLTSPANALTLEGGVKKIEAARKEAFLKPIWVIDATPYKAYANKAPKGYRKDFSDGGYSVIVGKNGFVYENNKLILIAKSDKNALEFPRTSYRYNYPSGTLNSVCHSTSIKDGYIFDAEGNLFVIFKNDIIYQDNLPVLSAITTIIN